jgi:hypothetical protein
MNSEQQKALAIASARLRLQSQSSAREQVQGDAITQAASDPTQGMSGLDKFLAGTGKGMSDIAVGVGQRLGLVDQESVDERAKRDAPLMDTGAGATGNVVGKVATALPTMFIPGANTVAGAAVVGAGLGAAEPTKTGESVGQNMVMGAAGGAGGQAAGNLLARALRPVQSSLDPATDALAQAAKRRGIPLDAADLTGSRPLTTIRDVMAQMPLTADRQAAIQGAKQGAYNRAVSQTFGENADQISPHVLTSARNRIGQQFTDLSSRNSLPVDNALLGKISDIVDEAKRFGSADVEKAVSNFADDLLNRVDQNGRLSGEAYRRMDSAMGRIMRSTSNGDIRHNLGQLRGVVRDAMDNAISPADQAAWKEARKQYANLMTVAPLAARDEIGDVSGKSLLAAALRGNKSAAFTGGGDLGELGRIGRAFIAEQTPNSGTAQRLFFQRFLENPLAASYGQAVGGISLPVQKLMNSRAGQKYLSEGLVSMSPRQKAALTAALRSAGTALPLAEAQQ